LHDSLHPLLWNPNVYVGDKFNPINTGKIQTQNDKLEYIQSNILYF